MRAALRAGAVPLQWVRAAEWPLRQKCQAAAGTKEKESSTALASPQVRIETQHSVAFGQVIKVVGSVEALGNWEATAAPGKPSLLAWDTSEWRLTCLCFLGATLIAGVLHAGVMLLPVK